MDILLMNKNTPVLNATYDNDNKLFTEIKDVYNINFAPLSVYNAFNMKGGSLVKALNNWFKGRGIPSWRQDLKRLLDEIGIDSAEDLLDKAFALSLSDQYWIKESSDLIKWEDINFFHNDFEYQGFLDASLSFSSSEHEISLHSPNNTTDGMIKKAWIIENGERVLVKGSYYNFQQEPINEWLVSNICDRLGFDYCDYTIEVDSNKLVSKCKNFVSDNEEILSAYDVFMSEKKLNHITDFEHYVNILESHGIPNARESLENMMIVDYLVMNFDRHMKNYGVIRNVETLKWERLTPIFDSGEAMQCDKNINDMKFFTDIGKYFSNTKRRFHTFLDDVSDLDRLDCSALDGLVDEYRAIELQYMDVTEISNERINKLINGLNDRIDRLYEIQCERSEIEEQQDEGLEP